MENTQCKVCHTYHINNRCLVENTQPKQEWEEKIKKEFIEEAYKLGTLRNTYLLEGDLISQIKG